jgi:hypothetical protein
VPSAPTFNRKSQLTQPKREVLAHMKSMTFKQHGKRSYLRGGMVKALIAAAVAVQLIACGGGGGGDSSASGTTSLTASEATPSAGSGTPTSSAPKPASTSSGQPSTSATGSMALSWVAPVARADGTPLSLADIEGFRIYYGNSANSYPYSVNVTDATTLQVTLNNLASGTYYIVMTTYDVDGRESSYSAVVKKTVS